MTSQKIKNTKWEEFTIITLKAVKYYVLIAMNLVEKQLNKTYSFTSDEILQIQEMLRSST